MLGSLPPGREMHLVSTDDEDESGHVLASSMDDDSETQYLPESPEMGPHRFSSMQPLSFANHQRSIPNPIGPPPTGPVPHAPHPYASATSPPRPQASTNGNGGPPTLSPTSPSTSSSDRPSSRKALTRALELAQEAVRLDSTNDDPHAAVIAYGKSVALLNEVMERVMRGEDSSDLPRKKHGRRRSVPAKEEEVRRLKSIHDTYADRMRILCFIYNISPIPVLETSTVSSPQPPVPTISRPVSPPNAPDPGPLPEEYDSAESIGSAMLTSASSRSSASSLVSPPTPTTSAPLPSAPTRLSVLPPARPPPAFPPPSRPRAGSSTPYPPPQLPPPLASPPPIPSAPPTAPLPSAPAIIEPAPSSPLRHQFLPQQVTRPRGNSTAHKRSGSGNERLSALDEETETSEDTAEEQTVYRSRASSLLNPNTPPPTWEAPRDCPPTPHSREAHFRDRDGPLPPLPPLPAAPPLPASGRASPASPLPSPMTPRGTSEGHGSSPPSSYATESIMSVTPRPRGNTGSSTASAHSEASGGSSTSGASSAAHPPHLVINSTAHGTISQRRQKSSVPATSAASSFPATTRLTASSLPLSTATSLGMMGRHRASSQPGRRPSLATSTSNALPEFRPSEFGVGIARSNTAIAGSQRKVSVPSRFNLFSGALPSPSLNAHASQLGQAVQTPGGITTLPTSPLPPPPPPDSVRRPYHLMVLLHTTMVSKTGGYITRKLHVPHDVWSQGGAKLANMNEKAKVVDTLIIALGDVHEGSIEFTGLGGIFGTGTKPEMGRKAGERWLSRLEEWERICEGLVGNFGKKLGVGEGFTGKKSSSVTSWGGKFARSFDRMTNGKSLDSPAHYVSSLAKLFELAQLFDDHTRAINTSPQPSPYACLPPELRASLEQRLKRTSEFFATVVLTFVVRDLGLLLDKFVKSRERWVGE